MYKSIRISIDERNNLITVNSIVLTYAHIISSLYVFILLSN